MYSSRRPRSKPASSRTRVGMRVTHSRAQERILQFQEYLCCLLLAWICSNCLIYSAKSAALPPLPCHSVTRSASERPVVVESPRFSASTLTFTDSSKAKTEKLGHGRRELTVSQGVSCPARPTLQHSRFGGGKVASALGAIPPCQQYQILQEDRYDMTCPPVSCLRRSAKTPLHTSSRVARVQSRLAGGARGSVTAINFSHGPIVQAVKICSAGSDPALAASSQASRDHSRGDRLCLWCRRTPFQAGLSVHLRM
jgi:hypothetical protein